MQLCRRVRFMRVFKRFCNVIVPDDFEPLRLAHRAIFIQRLVHHVPAVDFPLVAADHRRDVVVHALQQGVAIHRFAILIFKNPARRLIVPDQRVPNNPHAMLLSKRHVFVPRRKIIFVRLRMH